MVIPPKSKLFCLVDPSRVFLIKLICIMLFWSVCCCFKYHIPVHNILIDHIDKLIDIRQNIIRIVCFGIKFLSLLNLYVITRSFPTILCKCRYHFKFLSKIIHKYRIFEISNTFKSVYIAYFTISAAKYCYCIHIKYE